MIVIGLTGKKGAGKDSVADVLVKEHGFMKMSFAEPIKRMVEALDPIVGHDAYQDCACGSGECLPLVDDIRLSDLYAMGYDDETIKESPWGDEVRRLWQRFGTEAVRSQDENYWADLAQIKLLESGAEKVVFTDVRFPNEAEMIYNLGAPVFTNAEGSLFFSAFQTSVWQISRSELNEDEDGHESESHVGLLEEEVQIINDGTLDELPLTVNAALNYIINDEIPGQGLLWAGEAPSE